MHITMGPMAKNYLSKVGENQDSPFITSQEQNELSEVLGLDLSASDFQSNLERLMEVLLSTKMFLNSSDSETLLKAEKTLNGVIYKVINHVIELCSKKSFRDKTHLVHILYDKFYRKLTLRDRSLPRPWVFTTNYDLFSERAMDRASIPYINGFSGAVERRFNPATFNYALAQKLDISSQRWAEVDSLIYLCKLHGSINWVENGQGLFPIQELQEPPVKDANQRVMIYPTPSKQNTSFSTPYSDLFREFQKQVVTDQSILIAAGYGFGDEHVNNIIFQALTIPSFRLIAFIDPDTNSTTRILRELEDPRIWFVYGDGPTDESKAHYFENVVGHFMPESPGRKVETAIEKALQAAAGSLIKTSSGKSNA